jgi:hypothetical protein
MRFETGATVSQHGTRRPTSPSRPLSGTRISGVHTCPGPVPAPESPGLASHDKGLWQPGLAGLIPRASPVGPGYCPQFRGLRLIRIAESWEFSAKAPFLGGILNAHLLTARGVPIIKSFS